MQKRIYKGKGLFENISGSLKEVLNIVLYIEDTRLDVSLMKTNI